MITPRYDVLARSPRAFLFTFSLVLATAVVETSAPASAQVTPTWTFDGGGNFDYYGEVVAAIGDVDADGIDDVAIGNYNRTLVELRSGRTGASIWTGFGSISSSRYGRAVCGLGDVNGDGYADFAVGEPSGACNGTTGRVHFLSGIAVATGVGTLQLRPDIIGPASPCGWATFGTSLVPIPDVDGDGQVDLAIGDPQQTGGFVRIYSTGTGAQIRLITAPANAGRFGESFAYVGDIDGDGTGDFAIGAPDESTNGTSAGAVFRASGATGAILGSLTVLGQQTGAQFGFSVASGGDFNGDGGLDFAVGEPYYKSNTALVNQGRVWVFPRNSISFLCRQTGNSANAYLGTSMALHGDFDANGRADLLVGAPLELVNGTATGVIHMYTHSGSTTPTELLARPGSQASEYFGTAVDWLPNANGDGRSDLVVAGIRHDVPGLTDCGRVAILLAGVPASWGSFCAGDGTGLACPCNNVGALDHGCGNSQGTGGGRLFASGDAFVANDTLQLTASDLIVGTNVLFYQGTSTVAGGAGAVFGDGLRCVAGTVIRLGPKTATNRTATYPQLGDAPVSVRGLVPPAGGTRHYQAWYRDAATNFCAAAVYNLTNGISVTWAP